MEPGFESKIIVLLFVREKGRKPGAEGPGLPCSRSPSQTFTIFQLFTGSASMADSKILIGTDAGLMGTELTQSTEFNPENSSSAYKMVGGSGRKVAFGKNVGNIQASVVLQDKISGEADRGVASLARAVKEIL